MLGLIVDSVIEDILVLEEQDFNPSLVVVAVSGWGTRPQEEFWYLQSLVLLITRGGDKASFCGLRQPGKAPWRGFD